MLNGGVQMRTRMLKWGSIPILFLVLWALLWPLSAGYLTLLASGVCVGAISGFQVGRTGIPFWEAGRAQVWCKDKYEHSDAPNSLVDDLRPNQASNHMSRRIPSAPRGSSSSTRLVGEGGPT